MNNKFLRMILLTAGLFFFTGSANANPALSFFKDIEVHGFASSSYTANFNDPSTAVNNLRIFDTDSNSFKFDVGELVMLKSTPNKGDIGFRTDVTFGFSVPEVAKSAPGPNVAIGPGFDVSDDDFDLQQGYVSYNAPIGNGLQLDLGKFITHIGLEVIEGYDGWNYNYSRSFLFGLAIPFTHTGIRGAYEINDKVSILGMVANGWDQETDINDGKTFGTQIAVTPIENVTILFNWAGGPETTDESNWRHIFDVVASIAITDKTELQLNFDYGMEENTSLVTPGDDAEWWGFAGVIRHDFNNWFSLNFRGEFFDDEDATRASGLGASEELWEITITPEFRINEHFVARVEYRHDESSLSAFADDDGTLTDSQDTIAVNALFYF